MNRRESRVEIAVKIRNAALVKIRAEGGFCQVERVGSMWRWFSPEISMLLRTPFQRTPKQIHAGTIGKNLSWGLDIWVKRKVLNISWDDNGEVCLTSFKRGDWERMVLGWVSH